jgi:NADPH:quinone reductase-like Zn-dependent oxidoreductase
MKKYQIGLQDKKTGIFLNDTANEPIVSAGNVLVEIKACSLNYRDYMNVYGLNGITGSTGRVPGSDAMGEVIKVAGDVDQAWIGKRVVVPFMPNWLKGSFKEEYAKLALGGARDGVFQEIIEVEQAALVELPEMMSDEIAACLPCAAVTAWHALQKRAELKKGDVVLVQGTGGVSSFAIVIAKAIGARVIALTSRESKVEELKRLGADVVLVKSYTEDWSTEVLSITEGRGVDVVVEVGGAKSLNQSIKAVCYGGVILLIGVLTGLEADVQTGALLRKNIRLDGIYVGSREMLIEVVDFFSRTNHFPKIKKFSFNQLGEALEYLGQGEHVGKLVIAR